MAVEFVAYSTSERNTLLSVVQPSLPPEVEAGDLLLVWFTTRVSGGTITVQTPTGWEAVAAQANVTSSHRARAFWKIASASEPDPLFNVGGGGYSYVTTTVWRGVDQTTPIDATGSSSTASAAGTGSAPSITTVTDGAVAVFLFSTSDDNTLASPSQGTLAVSWNSSVSSDGSHAVVYLEKASAGATGTTSVTQTTNGNDNWCFTTAALRPAAVDAVPSTGWFDSTVELAVEFGFWSEPLVPSPSWDDETTNVRSFRISRGRTSEFEPVQAGTLELGLNNADRRFDPEHTAGPHYGELNPMTQVRVRARYDGTTYKLFRGFVQSWPQYYDPGNSWSSCDPLAVDAFVLLANRVLRASAYETEVLGDLPALYWPLRDESARVLADVSGNGLDGVPNGAVGATGSVVPTEVLDTGARRLAVTRVDDASITGPGPADPPVTIEAWVRPASTAFGTLTLTAASSSTSWLIVTLTASLESGQFGGVALDYQNADLTESYSAASDSTPWVPLSRPVHVVVTTDAGRMAVWFNGTRVLVTAPLDAAAAGTYSPGAGCRIVAGDPPESQSTNNWDVGHFAVYSRELSAVEIASHYVAGVSAFQDDKSGARVGRVLDAVGWPSGLRDVSDGSSWLASWEPGSSDALSALRSVADTEQGRLHVGPDGAVVFRDREWMRTATVAAVSQATFSDDGTELPYQQLTPRVADVDLIVNRVDVASSDGFTVTVRDTASIDAYLERPVTVAANLLNPRTARNLGQSIVDVRKDPAFRVEQLVLKPRGDADLWPVVLGVDLGHRVTVERTPQGVGDVIAQVLTVEGVTHEVTADDWTTTLYLAPAPETTAGGGFFVIGSSQLDDGDLLPH